MKRHIRIYPRDDVMSEEYDADSLDDVKPEHQGAVALLDTCRKVVAENQDWTCAHLDGVGTMQRFKAERAFYYLDVK